MPPEAAAMHAECGALEVPEFDGRTKQARLVLDARRQLELRLGPNPTFEARQAGNAALRLMAQIADLDRKRAEKGPLNPTELELLLRLENGLARSLGRLERFAPVGARAGA